MVSNPWDNCRVQSPTIHYQMRMYPLFLFFYMCITCPRWDCGALILLVTASRSAQPQVYFQIATSRPVGVRQAQKTQATTAGIRRYHVWPQPKKPACPLAFQILLVTTNVPMPKINTVECLVSCIETSKAKQDQGLGRPIVEQF